MNYLKWATIAVLVLGLMVGCADRQDEADQLEQEMLSTDGEGDTTGTEAMVEDTAAAAMDVAAVPAEEEEPAFTSAAEMTGGYAVQIASCEALEYAQYLVEVYTRRGYEPYITDFDGEMQRYYRVRIGNMESHAQAVKLKDELIDRFSIDPWIDQL